MPRITIINDTPCMQRALQRLLAEEGFEVAVYAHGIDAIHDLRRNPPDVLMLDQTNKPMGTELFAQLDHETCPPVIFVTPHAEDVQWTLGQRGTPAADYLPTPFSNRELVRRVRNLLD